MGRKKNPDTELKRAQAAHLRDGGHSFTSIGERLGVTKQREEQLVKGDRRRPVAPCPTCGHLAEVVSPWLTARRAKGWSTREAAAAAGVSASLVSRIENGREIELSAGVALARAYGVPVESLMPAPAGEEV